MKIINEFRTFALRGNVVDLAVGVVVGSAFGKIVSSFVADILMPPINFRQLALTLSEGTETSDPVLLRYGSFLQTTIDFVIIAASVFLVVRFMNSLQKKKEAEPPPEPPKPTPEQQLLAEIRDALREGH